MSVLFKKIRISKILKVWMSEWDCTFSSKSFFYFFFNDDLKKVIKNFNYFLGPLKTYTLCIKTCPMSIKENY